ncbi:MAG: hypothetical protein ACREM1_06840, partial [Longimicrobiales bacterium]
SVSAALPRARPARWRDFVTAAWRPSTLRKPWRRAIIAGLGVIAIAIAAARLTDRTPSPQSLTVPIDPAGYDPSRIAVLYFEDLSEAHDVGHIASGLTEALITELDHVEALSVVSRDGVKPFVDSIVPPQQIAATLRAGSIVAGSVQHSGDQLRLTVHLVEGATGSLLESATLQRPMGELFELHDDLARRVARILRDRIGREVSIRRLTRAGKPEAWELVRRAIERGEEIWLAELPILHERKRGAKHELDAAEEYLRRAERIDSSWAEPTRLRGWLALGRAKLAGAYDTAAYNREIRNGLAVVDELFSRGFNDARAYELRGTLRLQLAQVNQPDPRYLALRDSAEYDLRIAVSRDPTLAGASNRLSILLQFAGNPREARYYANNALRQDAFLRDGPDIQYRLYSTSMDLYDISGARDHCLAGQVDYPEDWRFLQCQLLIAAYGGAQMSPDSAGVLVRAWSQLDPPPSDQQAQYTHLFRRILYAAVLAQAGLHESARDSLEQIRRKVEQNPERLARPFGLDEASLLLMLGDTAHALRAIRDYVTQNPMYREYVKSSVQIKPLHADPRFLEIVRDTTPN